MKTFFKYIGYFLFLLFTVIVFLPKSNVYYKAEERLSQNSIVITNEDIKSSLFDFEINKALLIYAKSKFAKVEDVKIKSYLFYNSIDVTNIEVLDKFTKQYPVKTKNLNLTYSVLNPLFVDIKAVGDFGEINGKIDLINKKINLVLIASSNMKRNYKSILRKMKLNKGEYTYEQQF